MSKLHQGSAYLSTIIYTNRKLAKLAKSLRHSLRVEIDGESSISYQRDMKILNSVLFPNMNNNEIQHLKNMEPEYYLDFIDKTIKSNIEKEEVVKVDKKDQQMRSKSLKYLNTNIKDNNFKELLNTFTEKQTKGNKEDLIKYFNSLGLKRTIEKNLYKYIEVVEKIGGAKNRREAKLSNVERVEFVEMVVKIPYENNQTSISSEEMILYNQRFFNKYFPNYEIVVSVGHNDELHQLKSEKNIQKLKDKGIEYSPKLSGYHSHTFINTKNKTTGEFDYYKQQHLLVREYLLNKGISEEQINKDIGFINNKGVRVQTLKQIKNQGENLQDFIYEDINKDLFNKYGYDAIIGFNDLTPSQKRSMEKDKTLSINKRTYNGLNLEKEQLQQREDIIENIENNIEQVIKEKNKELIETFEDIETQTIKVSIEKVGIETELSKVKEDLLYKNDLIISMNEDIDKLKNDKSVIQTTKSNAVKEVKEEVNNVLNSNLTTYKMLDKEKLKPLLLKMGKNLIKYDIFEEEINKEKEKVNKEKFEEIRGLKEEIRGLKEEIRGLKEENEDLPNKIKEAVNNKVNRIELDYLKKETELNGKVKDIENQLINKDTKIDKLETSQLELNKENTKHLKTIGRMEEEIRGLKDTIKTLSNKYNTFKDKVKNIFTIKNKSHKKTKRDLEKEKENFEEYKEISENIEPGIRDKIYSKIFSGYGFGVKIEDTKLSNETDLENNKKSSHKQR
ncbi:hypothetical protein [Sulfurimonas xiamenensis]|uniref:Uncharacterized protein n=1 Tax=Sulfurimonas xiamenensis TaxID=2590021 RepID=A0AAJ4A529_9BACT|nr:hypothetical protein [Sulfurimonas xiamenensis]QFR44058.1 hypothetical protein FJR47_09065 [Sulfurimonas xiamenensis]